MKSEMFTGIEFEYTLDGVLFEKYEKSLVGKYYVNLDYLMDHLEELIQLRDVVIPHRMIPLSEIRAAMGERTYLSVPQQYRDSLRASVFKNMLLTLLDT